MEEKLKSISRRIHWSLLLKAAIFGVAWFWLPWWLFAVVALILYFVPFFHTGKLALPFFVFLIISYVQAPSSLFAFAFGAIFYFLLLLKDLLLIDRRAAHELLTFALSFLLLRSFYLRFDQGLGGAAFFFSFCVAALIALLVRNYMTAFAEQREGPLTGAERLGVWLTCLLVWQFTIATLFLPLDFVYQTVIAFLPVLLVIELLPDYLAGDLPRIKLLGSSTVVFVLLVVIMASARWGL